MKIYDARQYNLLRERFESFLGGALRLSNLINDAEALFCALQHPNPLWSSKFRDQLLDLEIIHAEALDRDAAISKDELIIAHQIVTSMLINLPSINVEDKIS